VINVVPSGAVTSAEPEETQFNSGSGSDTQITTQVEIVNHSDVHVGGVVSGGVPPVFITADIQGSLHTESDKLAAAAAAEHPDMVSSTLPTDDSATKRGGQSLDHRYSASVSSMPAGQGDLRSRSAKQPGAVCSPHCSVGHARSDELVITSGHGPVTATSDTVGRNDKQMQNHDSTMNQLVPLSAKLISVSEGRRVNKHERGGRKANKVPGKLKTSVSQTDSALDRGCVVACEGSSGGKNCIDSAAGQETNSRPASACHASEGYDIRPHRRGR